MSRQRVQRDLFRQSHGSGIGMLHAARQLDRQPFAAAWTGAQLDEVLDRNTDDDHPPAEPSRFAAVIDRVRDPGRLDGNVHAATASCTHDLAGYVDLIGVEHYVRTATRRLR